MKQPPLRAKLHAIFDKALDEIFREIREYLLAAPKPKKKVILINWEPKRRVYSANVNGKPVRNASWALLRKNLKKKGYASRLTYFARQHDVETRGSWG